MQNIKRLITMAVIFVLFLLLMICVATKSVKGEINKIHEHNCVIELANNTNKTYVFWLMWVDHPFLQQTRGKPWIKICAEIDPGEIFAGNSNHAPGLYTVICQERWKHDTKRITRNFTIRPKTRKIIITIITVSPMNTPIITLDFTPIRPIGGSKPN